MKIKSFEFNPVRENTYVVYDETGECAIIDPGCYFQDEKEELLNFILDNELVVKHVLNTHLHFDHIFGLNFTESQFGMKTEANKDDEFLLKRLPEELQMFGFSRFEGEIPTIAKYLDEGDVVTFGNQRFAVFKIPGHSPGSIIFYNDKAQCAFVGDVLFRGSVGRTDMPGGSHTQLIDGIRKKLLTLPPETVIYPGHGPATTLKFEAENNPFLIG